MIDHHCPWLSVCIGKHNHKRFLILIVYSLFHSILHFSFNVYILVNYGDKICTSTYLTCLFLVVFSGLVNIFLTLLILYQIYFISQDITTSEYLRMDKYKANLFDDNFKLNWKKFLFDEENFETDLIYNDNAKQIMQKTYLIKDFYKCLSTEEDKEKNHHKKDIDKKSNDQKETKEKDSKIEVTSDQIITDIEYFKSEQSGKSKFLEN